MTVVLDRTPFYAESGGQVGDTGDLVGDDFAFRVSDTQRDGDLVLHIGHLVSGKMRAGATVKARVSTPTGGGRSAEPIRQHTSCTTHCRRILDATPNNRVRKSTVTGCVLISPILLAVSDDETRSDRAGCECPD